jgi:hypothetical protein
MRAGANGLARARLVAQPSGAFRSASSTSLKKRRLVHKDSCAKDFDGKHPAMAGPDPQLSICCSEKLGRPGKEVDLEEKQPLVRGHYCPVVVIVSDAPREKGGSDRLARFEERHRTAAECVTDVEHWSPPNGPSCTRGHAYCPIWSVIASEQNGSSGVSAG